MRSRYGCFEWGETRSGDVATSTRKHKIFGQMWVLFPSLRVQNEGYVERFRRSTENTEIFVFEVTGGELKSDRRDR